MAVKNKKTSIAVFILIDIFIAIVSAIAPFVFRFGIFSIRTSPWYLESVLKMLPADRNARYFAKDGKGGISCKLAGALSMALLFALVESFLAGTSNHSFIWVYKWWGVIPVFITTYIPFFLASNYVPDMAPAKRKRFLITVWGLVAVLLIVLIPLGII